MSNEPRFPSILKASLWHTTHGDRFAKIIKSGHILPNPPLPERGRWFTAGGSETYLYVRHLGGVSLFDFRNFEPRSYSKRFPMCSWAKFVPYIREWKASLWIEIDETALGEGYIRAADLYARHRQENADKHNIMPLIEAAHLGPIPISAFRRILIASAADPQPRPVDLSPRQRREQ